MRELVLIWVAMLAGLALLAFGTIQTNVPSPLPPASLAQGNISSSQTATNTPRVGVGKNQKEIPATYPVVKVVDGDTVVIKRNGRIETLRLIGMDAPETTTLRRGAVECFGTEATKRAEELLRGLSVSLETDVSQGTYDKYERTLAYIFLPDGRNFAEVMIEGGYAHEYTYSLPYKYQREFRAAQKKAQTKRHGLWLDSACYGLTKSVNISTPITPPSSGTYECSKNTYNCSSFKSQAEAQAAFDGCGGSNNDIHKLDSDEDRRVCEGLP